MKSRIIDAAEGSRGRSRQWHLNTMFLHFQVVVIYRYAPTLQCRSPAMSRLAGEGRWLAVFFDLKSLELHLLNREKGWDKTKKNKYSWTFTKSFFVVFWLCFFLLQKKINKIKKKNIFHNIPDPKILRFF